MNFPRIAFWALMFVGGLSWTIALHALAQVLGGAA